MMRIINLSKNARLQLLQGIWKRSPSSRKTVAKAQILLKSSKKRIFSFIASSSYQPTLFINHEIPQNEPPTKKHKRIKSSYSDNYTAALELPCTSEELESLNDQAIFERSKPLIIEHASRRVDLFFYTLIAYYQTKAHPKQGHTKLQHGSGRNLSNNKNITQGCHSSFLPSLIEDNDDKVDEGLLSGTHFMDSLNSTVELPPYVNELDNEFENTCFGRKKSLEILGKVAQGEINPVQGLTQFLIMLDKIFNEIEANPFRIEKFFCKYRKLMPELIKLTKIGTLNEKFRSNKKTPKYAYIELLLRLTPEEKLASKACPENRDKIYLEKIEEIQHEILNTKTVFQFS